ncbi:hypothetical protein [Roseibium alexandrii]|uniref:Uncharacterized protein n=1 Tax=Roseibium alexandrii TaxID=388408 RepID=A0A0M7AFF9_9HYPH|nr:hypothetical protein [Roseibium alexandrii]CTQ73629.1 hypothetical protein LAX5112_03602 [Roseibium alexandrii]
MTESDVHNDKIRFPERGQESVHEGRWGETGGIQAIRPLRSRTSQSLKPSSAFGQGFRDWLRWILTPPLTHLWPSRSAYRPAGKPLKGHARERAWTAISASFTRSTSVEKMASQFDNRL